MDDDVTTELELTHNLCLSLRYLRSELLFNEPERTDIAAFVGRWRNKSGDGNRSVER